MRPASRNLPSNIVRKGGVGVDAAGQLGRGDGRTLVQRERHQHVRGEGEVRVGGDCFIRRRGLRSGQHAGGPDQGNTPCSIGGAVVQPTPAEDWPAVADTGSEAWRHTLDHLKQTHQARLEAVSTLSDRRLLEKVPGKEPDYYTFYYMLHGIAQHERREPRRGWRARAGPAVPEAHAGDFEGGRSAPVSLSG